MFALSGSALESFMIPASTTLLHGLELCVPFTIFVVVTFWRWPRLWLHSLPSDIQDLAGPKTEVELRQTKWLLVVYLILLPGGSIASIVYASTQLSNELTIMGAFVHLYGIWLCIHLWDLVIIDVGHMLLINPESPPIPGTEYAAGYGNLGFHGLSFLRACVMSLFFVIPAAVVAGLTL